jgi:hypothetical protein
MGKIVLKIFFGILAACVVLSMSAEDAKKETTKGDAKGADTDKSTVDANCKNSNDFQYERCGPTTLSLCCKTREKCVGPVKPKLGAEMYVCSKARQLSGQKAVYIVILPMFGMIMDIALVAFMVVKLNIAKNHVTKVCVAAIVFSWPLYLSSMWATGFFSAFLALLVAFMSEAKGFPIWIYRLTLALVVFQVIAIFGPYETFHVLLYGQSKADINTELIKNAYKPTAEADCNKFYADYFTVLKIEKQAKDADPDKKYFGLCTMEWLATVQTFCLFQGIIWMVCAVVSAPSLLYLGDSSMFKEVAA